MAKIKDSGIRFLFFALILNPALAFASATNLVFGIHPYLPATELVERFTPLMQYLEKELNINVRFRVGTNYQDHIDAISRNEIDFAYMGPASYVRLVDQFGPWPLAAKLSFSGSTQFRGAIIAKKNSAIKKPGELEGKTFAFGDPNSTLSFLVPKAVLEQSGVTLDKLKHYKHLKNHHNVALAVLLGRYDAGGIKDEVLWQYQPRGLKVIEYTPFISSHLFIFGRKLPEEMREKIRQALFNLDKVPEGPEILALLKKKTTALVPVEDQDYDSLRQMILPQWKDSK